MLNVGVLCVTPQVGKSPGMNAALDFIYISDKMANNFDVDCLISKVSRIIFISYKVRPC